MAQEKLEYSLSESRDAAALLYENGFSGILISVITSSFLVFAFTEQAFHHKFIWWLVMTALLGVRLIDWFLWRKQAQGKPFDGKRWTRRFILGVHLTAILWSIYLVGVILVAELIETSAAIIAVSAMAGGAATVLAGHKKTAMFYSITLLVPASCVLMLSAEDAKQVLGILGMCFGFVMLVISMKSADFTKKAIRLKHENVELLAHMEEQVEERTKRIYELSNLDPLTGLYNRSAFTDSFKGFLSEADQHNKRVALLFVDLDGFKKINDSFGHEIGDQILRKTAERLAEEVGDRAHLCRWGGDEFLVVLDDVTEQEAKKRGQQIIDCLSVEHETTEAILAVGATLGVALYPTHSKMDSELIQFADTAMYHQKKISSGSVCVFYEDLLTQHNYELLLKAGLSEAIERQELRLVFQPIVNSKTGRPQSFEALLRWNFNGKEIPPDQFIGIAEQYGLIQRIGAWVLREACRVAAQWQGLNALPVCVNVSVIQLQDPDFLKLVHKVLEDTQLDPKLLTIEITESVFATDKEMICEKISALQALGISVSIDDFGTGYSSLSVMQDLSVNTVKIDRAFINKLDGTGFAIVTAVIHAARFLKFEVVAEGVETEAQKQRLADIGVPKLQGFYFSRPIELDDLRDYISRDVA